MQGLSQAMKGMGRMGVFCLLDEEPEDLAPRGAFCDISIRTIDSAPCALLLIYNSGTGLRPLVPR